MAVLKFLFGLLSTIIIQDIHTLHEPVCLPFANTTTGVNIAVLKLSKWGRDQLSLSNTILYVYVLLCSFYVTMLHVTELTFAWRFHVIMLYIYTR